MGDLLFPLLGEAPPVSPDDELGEAAYFGPVEADNATIDGIRVERPTVIVFHVPFASDQGGTAATAAVDAVLAGRWTRRHIVDLAGGDEAVEYFLGQLVEYADCVRAYRHAGRELFDATPWAAAGTVVSFEPGETLPAGLVDRLNRWRGWLNTCAEEPELFSGGYAAALAIVALGGADGMPVRREVWAS